MNGFTNKSILIDLLIKNHLAMSYNPQTHKKMHDNMTTKKVINTVYIDRFDKVQEGLTCQCDHKVVWQKFSAKVTLKEVTMVTENFWCYLPFFKYNFGQKTSTSIKICCE